VNALTVCAKTVSRQTFSSFATASLHTVSLIAVRNIDVMHPRSVKTMGNYISYLLLYLHQPYHKRSPCHRYHPNTLRRDDGTPHPLQPLSSLSYPSSQPHTILHPTSNPSSHPLHRQRTSMSLLSNNMLPPQEPSTNSTTRSKRNRRHSQSSQYSNPVSRNHTSNFGVPGEVEEPEVR
jgi:hypothetical protein